MTEESAGHVEVCVQSTGTVSQFRVQSFDSSAQGKYPKFILMASNVYTTVEVTNKLYFPH